MNFILHPNLAKKTFIIDLTLCTVLLEDEKNYPWIFLIPKRDKVAKIMDLSFEDQIQLLKELDWAQKIIWQEFAPTQINVAAIGNKTSQLHVHVIARFAHDPAWPGTVWDHPVREKYTAEEKQRIVELIQAGFEQYLS